VQQLDFAGHSRRRKLRHIIADQLHDLKRVLIGHQAAGDLRGTESREYGLAALAGPSAHQAIDFKRGARSNPLVDRISCLTIVPADTRLSFEAFQGKRRLGQFGPLVVTQRAHPVVESRHGDPPIGIMHGSQDIHQRVQRVMHRAAINPRMKIMSGAAHNDLKAHQPAQSVDNGWSIQPQHTRIGDHDYVCFQQVSMLLNKRVQVIRTIFFFALNDELDIHRQLPSLQQRLHRFDLGQSLAFVIGCAARI